jgi:DNA-binding response OmpR family regulator
MSGSLFPEVTDMRADLVERDFPLPINDNSMICPCCLQFVEGVQVLADPTTCRIAVGNKTVSMKRRQFELAKHLLDAFPLTATTDRIMKQVFGPKNGRELKSNVAAVVASQLRPILADLGFRIDTIRGTGYRLVRIHTAGRVQ